MDKGSITIIDTATGEVVVEIHCLDIDQLKQAISGTVKQIDKSVRNKSRARSPEFYMGYQMGLRKFYKDSGLNPTDKLVFSHLLATMGYAGRIKQTQVEIAEELGVNRVTVNRAFQRLKAADVIYQDAKITNSVRFRVNMAYATKGKTSLVDSRKLIESYKRTSTGIALKVVEGGNR